MLLWHEYLAEHPDGYNCSHFCERYRQWQKASEKTTMRKPKKAGEEVEVDYAGLTVPVTGPETGEVHDTDFRGGIERQRSLKAVTWRVIEVALWFASRNPIQHRFFFKVIIGLEIVRGIIDDIYMLIRGYDPVSYIGRIIVHTIVIVWAYIGLRQTRDQGVT